MRVCGACGVEGSAPNVALSACGGCREVLYCSVPCQRRAWREGHKSVCLKKAEAAGAAQTPWFRRAKASEPLGEPPDPRTDAEGTANWLTRAASISGAAVTEALLKLGLPAPEQPCVPESQSSTNRQKAAAAAAAAAGAAAAPPP